MVFDIVSVIIITITISVIFVVADDDVDVVVSISISAGDIMSSRRAICGISGSVRSMSNVLCCVVLCCEDGICVCEGIWS